MRPATRFSACARIAAILLAACITMPASAQREQNPRAIRWRAAGLGPAAPAETDPGIVLAAKKNRHVVVQLDQIPAPAERKDLAAAGIKLLRYLGGNAFFAKVTGGDGAVAAARAGGVTATFEIETEWKLHPMLLRGEYPRYARFPARAVAGRLTEESTEAEADVDTLALYVIFHPDVDLDSDGAAAIKRHGGLIRSTIRSINGAVVWIPLANLIALGQEDVVQWLEPPLPPLDIVNDSNRAITQADTVQAPPYGLDGSGITVLVYDGGYALASHGDFGGRLTARDASGLSDHATHVCGTVGGDGAGSGGQYRGMAPAVTIESYGFEMDGGLQPGFLYTDPGDLEADYNEAINTYGAVIANNSIGTNTAANGYPCEWEGNYGATSMLIDAIVGGSLGAPMRIIWANGNERGWPARCGMTYLTTAPPACAKNHITVGALNANDDSMTSFSSWGPTDDGRLKPDISAPGCQSDGDNGVTSTVSNGGYDTFCGTSMASPTVCGLSALILQDFKAQYPGDPLPRNSTLKILLAHNAVDLGNPGPDYKFGYGSVRVQDTIDFMRGGSFLEGTVGQGEEQVYYVDVLPGASSLKATLAWDDPPGAVNTIPELVNDLDIVVVSPDGGTTYYPWTLDPDPNYGDNPAVRTQPDRANNIEQVVVDNPEAGIWTVRVSGYSVPTAPQVFSLAGTPDVQMCSSAGAVRLDADTYGCSATVKVTVVDCDLNADPGTAETITINVSSAAEPAGENVLLTETTGNSAKFVGTVDLAETDASGVLQVGHGDTVTAVYNDADDGTGSPAVVQDTAAVDCVGPVIANVASSFNGATAVVTFDTDEPARGTVRYGLSCGDLAQSATGSYGQTSHSVNLFGLDPNTTYFYAVDAEDVAGNTSTDDNGGSCYTFTTPDAPDDYFTELFAGDNDLDNVAITFTPDGSANHYAACLESISALPTDPTGGTLVILTDDDYAQAILSGATVSLYGQTYGDFYVGSNGYLTFTAGDTSYAGSLDGHFDLPRISGLFADLDPWSGGEVSLKELGDRVAVTWQDVPEYGAGNSNTFQIEMFFDGRIRASWLGIAATGGLAGLSRGLGTPLNFAESDLSAYGSCGPRPPTALPVSQSAQVDTPVDITLTATDDGLPDPPGALSTIITSLPDHGSLSDPNAGPIPGAPYTLVGGGNVVTYTPDTAYIGADGFTFKANDGGTPPDGGDSNEAAVSITVTDCRSPAPTDPDPADGATDVPVDADLSWNNAGTSARQGAPEPGAAAPGDSAIGVPADVLLLATGGDPTILRTALAGLPDINSVDYLDGTAAAPTLADLVPYDVVVVMTNDVWADAITTGNVLADYVDAGGGVIQSWASFGSGGGWELAGRFVTAGGYEPFIHGELEFVWTPLSLGNFDANHPIMDGITALGDWLTARVALQPGAVWVAEWDDGTPLVATQGSSVVGINIAAFDEGFYSGDVALLFRNAAVWLMAGTTTYDVYFGTDNPPATKICSDLSDPVCDPGALQTNNTYYWKVIAKNRCGEAAGPLWSFDTPRFYRLVLTENFPARGDVEIVPEPNDPNDMQFPEGTTVTLTAYPAADRSFEHWKISDPNFPDDPNHVTFDANETTSVVMDGDRHVHAVWRCGDGVEQALPLLMVAAALCGFGSRRMRRRCLPEGRP